MTNLEEVLQKMKENLAVRTSFGWINEMAPNVFLLYGNSDCNQERLLRAVVAY